MDIGKRMKELRVFYGLTQQELADRAELTKGFISQLERNQNTPSVSTLLDIIQCLGTTPAEFFAEQKPEQIVFQKDDYFEKIDNGQKTVIEWVVPNAQKNSMEPIRLTIKPGGISEDLLPHEGEEFGYILQGTVKLVFGTQKYILHTGDSFAFPSTKRHHLENSGKCDAVILWITTPPSF
jgi:transcriptional regulator with XRE-family HTH domain